MTNVDASTSLSFPSSSSSTPKIFRLKRKIDDDPLSTLALSIKKSRRSFDFKIESDSQPNSGNVIHDVLHLTASSSCPIAPEYSNVDYHDLNIIDDQLKKGKITDVEIPSSNDIREEDHLDLLKIDPHLDQKPSSPNKRRKFCPLTTTENADDNNITCNGRPMCKIKKRENDDNHLNCDHGDYVYDFYMPKSYNVFKDGLPDKITCRIDTENLIDGVISLNACSENFDDKNGCFYDDQHFSSLYLSHNESSNSAGSHFDPYYYRNERNIDRMYDSNLQTENKSLQKSVKFSHLLLEKSNWRRPLRDDDDEDEDSNDENNYKNDYPDEDQANSSSSDDDDLDNLHVFKERRSKNDDEEEEEDLENYLDDGDIDLMSKFDDFYLENY